MTSFLPRLFLRRTLLGLSAGVLCACAGYAADAASAAVEPTVSAAEAECLATVKIQAENQPDAAIQTLRQRTGPNASSALDFALAALLAQQQHFDEAQQSLETAVKKFPSFQRAWLLLGRVRLLQGKNQTAPEALRKALALGADSAEIFKLLAVCHLREGHSVAAESACRAALALTPDDEEVQTSLVRALLMQKHYAAAEPLLAELNTRHPSDARYWMLRAESALGRDDSERALVLLECARRLGALDGASRLTLGDLYFNTGLYDEAAACYGESASTNALPVVTGLRYAESLLEAGRPELARTLLAKTDTKKIQDSARLESLLARLSKAEGNTAQTEKHLNAALRADPLNGSALLMLAQIQQQQGHNDAALLTLERAARADGFERKALLAMAQVYAAEGDYDQAVGKLTRVQEIHFDADVARYLKQIAAQENRESDAER